MKFEMKKLHGLKDQIEEAVGWKLNEAGWEIKNCLLTFLNKQIKGIVYQYSSSEPYGVYEDRSGIHGISYLLVNPNWLLIYGVIIHELSKPIPVVKTCRRCTAFCILLIKLNCQSNPWTTGPSRPRSSVVRSTSTVCNMTVLFISDFPAVNYHDPCWEFFVAKWKFPKWPET